MGVYEVLYDANGLFADRPVSERLAVAERVFAGLVNDGAVTLWRGKWIGSEQPRKRVLEGEVAQLLRSWSTWAPEDGAPVVYMELVPGT
jgi:hypothetical protein